MEKFQRKNVVIDLRDSRIFRALYEDIYPSVYFFAMRLLNDNVVSEDIVQEAFLYMWQKNSSFHNVKAFKSYLYCCVKNNCMNYIRDHRSERDMQELDENIVDEVAIDHLIIEQELRAQILEEINKLSEIKKDIMLLRLEGRSYNEISRHLDLSINTIKTHKKQIYKKLKIRLFDLKNALIK